MMENNEVPLSWYAIVEVEGTTVMVEGEKHRDFHLIESYLGVYDNINDPKLERCIIEGKKCAKLTSSRLNGVTDIEDVSEIIYHITTSMTAVFRIHQAPRRLNATKFFAVYADGTEKEHRHDGKIHTDVSNATLTASGRRGEPRLTDEQVFVEFVLRSEEKSVSEVINFYALGVPDFFTLFKIFEVITWDLAGLGNDRDQRIKDGEAILRARHWVPPDRISTFIATAHNAYRHWNLKIYKSKMEPREARALIGTIVDEWLAEKFGFKLNGYRSLIRYPWMKSSSPPSDEPYYKLSAP